MIVLANTHLKTDQELSPLTSQEALKSRLVPIAARVHVRGTRKRGHGRCPSQTVLIRAKETCLESFESLGRSGSLSQLLQVSGNSMTAIRRTPNLPRVQSVTSPTHVPYYLMHAGFREKIAAPPAAAGPSATQPYYRTAARSALAPHRSSCPGFIDHTIIFPSRASRVETGSSAMFGRRACLCIARGSRAFPPLIQGARIWRCRENLTGCLSLAKHESSSEPGQA